MVAPSKLEEKSCSLLTAHTAPPLARDSAPAKVEFRTVTSSARIAPPPQAELAEAMVLEALLNRLFDTVAFWAWMPPPVCGCRRWEFSQVCLVWTRGWCFRSFCIDLEWSRVIREQSTPHHTMRAPRQRLR